MPKIGISCQKTAPKSLSKVPEKMFLVITLNNFIVNTIVFTFEISVLMLTQKIGKNKDPTIQNEGFKSKEKGNSTKEFSRLVVRNFESY